MKYVIDQLCKIKVQSAESENSFSYKLEKVVFCSGTVQVRLVQHILKRLEFPRPCVQDMISLTWRACKCENNPLLSQKLSSRGLSKSLEFRISLLKGIS